MKRIDYYCGIGLLAILLLVGDYGLHCSFAQSNVHNKTIEAEAFLLTDKQGNLRGDLSTTPDGNPIIDLLDDNEKPRVVITLDKNHNGSIAVFDKSLNIKSMLSQSGSSGMLVLQDNEGHTKKIYAK